LGEHLVGAGMDVDESCHFEKTMSLSCLWEKKIDMPF
jgi:hypothetical protein